MKTTKCCDFSTAPCNREKPKPADFTALAEGNIHSRGRPAQHERRTRGTYGLAWSGPSSGPIRIFSEDFCIHHSRCSGRARPAGRADDARRVALQRARPRTRSQLSACNRHALDCFFAGGVHTNRFPMMYRSDTAWGRQPQSSTATGKYICDSQRSPVS